MFDIDDLLNLFPGYVINIDEKTKTILSLRKNGQILCENVPFDMVGEIVRQEKVKMGRQLTIKDLLFFVEKDNIQGSFIYPLKMEDGKEHYFQVSKYRNHVKQEILVYVECLDEKKELSNLTDQLTNVYQKFTFEQFVKDELKKPKHKEFSIIMIDIDRFKQFNDNYGHQFGDVILQEVAKVLKKNFVNGYIGRMGGDEFGVCDFDLVDKITIDKKMKAVLKEINKITAKYPELVKDSVVLSISAGVALYPKEGKRYKLLLECADKALYLGKNTTKNCYYIYKEELLEA